MAQVLVVAEHANDRLNSSTAKCVTCAAGVPGAEIDVVVFAEHASEVASQAARLVGVSRVLTVEHPAHAEPLAACIAPERDRHDRSARGLQGGGDGASRIL